jgi:uncharacterized protein
VELENVFQVDERRDVVWEVLMDVPRVVPCLPGATLTETRGDDHWKADLVVRLRPASMTFDADVTRQSADPIAGKVSLAVKAREKRGRGAATAEILSELDAVDGGTKVTLTTSVRLQGAVARIGRSEIVEEVSPQMVDSFATCLEGKMTGQLAAGEAPKPPSMIRMVLRSL